MTDLANLVVRMQADNSQYIAALNQATTRLAKFQAEQEDILSDLAKKFAAAFAVDKIVEFSAGAIEAQSNLQKFSEEAGVSVETLSAMQLAFAASGVNSDELGTSLKKLNQAASDAAGNPIGKAAQAFDILGINVKDANGDMKDAAQLQGEIADAYSKLADGPNKVAIQIALMGRNSLAMIPQLNQGSQALKDMEQAAIDSGAALSGPAAQAAKELQDKLDGLAATSKAQLQNAIAAELVPALNALVEAFGNAKDRGEAFQVIASEIVTGFKIIATIGLEVSRTFQSIGDGLGSLGAQAVALAHGRFSEVNAISADNQAQQEARDKKFADAEAALWNSSANAQIEAAQRGANGASEAAGASGKAQPANLEAREKAASAVEELQKFSAGLREQAQTFGLGSEAQTQFALSTGRLKKAMDEASQGSDKQVASAKAAAAEAIAAARAFQGEADAKTVKDFSSGLNEQIAKLHESDVAAFQYQLTSGKVGDALTRMAKAGNDARPALTALNNQLIDFKDNKAVEAINDQLDQMNGKLVAAAGHAFDLAHEQLTDNLKARSDAGDTTATAQLAQVQALKDATTAQAAYAEQVQKGHDIELAFATTEANINAARAAGTITDLQAQSQLNDARVTEIAQLNTIADAEGQIATAANLPKLINDTQTFRNQITGLAADVNKMTAQVRDGMETAFADNFTKLINGTESFRKALQGFFQDLEKQLDQIVSKNIAQSIFGVGGPAGGAPSALGSLFGGGSSGGGLGALAGLFGGGGAGSSAAPDLSGTNAAVGADLSSWADTAIAGAFAGGGDIPAGKFGVVGENGPELAYAGKNSSMQIVPATSNKSANVTNHFVVSAPGGTITRQSQSQMAAAAARSLAQASRRNN